MTRFPLLALTFLMSLWAGSARAQCFEQETTAPSQFSYSPSRSPGPARNGTLNIAMSRDGAAWADEWDTASRAFMTATAGRTTSYVARVDILLATANMETWFFMGGGDAGTTLSLEVRDSAGTLVCSQEVAQTHAEYWGSDTYTPQVRVLSCSETGVSPGTFRTVSVRAHGWVHLAGFSGGDANLTANVLSISTQECTESCYSGSACKCDDACAWGGDCCDDFGYECTQNACVGRCGIDSVDHSCWCDDLCESYGDCCADKYYTCD